LSLKSLFSQTLTVTNTRNKGEIMNESKWFDNIQVEPMIWFGFFVGLLLLATYGNINDTASKMLFMGSGFCANRIRSPKTA
jgi:hypothetical protein